MFKGKEEDKLVKLSEKHPAETELRLKLD